MKVEDGEPTDEYRKQFYRATENRPKTFGYGEHGMRNRRRDDITVKRTLESAAPPTWVSALCIISTLFLVWLSLQ